jgi:BolA protein
MADVRDTRERIEAALRARFAPERIEVVDESAQHAGHAGAREHGGGHFAVTIVSAAFDGRSAVERHRMVYAALADEMRGAVHALALTTRTPAEWDARRGE